MFGNDLVKLAWRSEKVAVLALDNPKVNSLCVELRNSLLHSGGKINSKFKRFLKDNLKIKKAQLNQKFTSDYSKFFDLLYEELKVIVETLKKS